ncbi:SMC-Scp complex subunit ScpB [Rothia aerolata]|uniref:Segregation and condensation protein B n=1 Tax=Rothia aerolata TaxID=1812262 RepID=A0A917IQL5_9MICC|nr:SMC-Scp complex subunit ScpB [Rothia aerolata]GGH59617.1 segregation and condensation protein B [Rothia aerolata]
MSDITGENPDFTDDDLAILLSGSWGAEEAEDTVEAEEPTAPENPWSEPAEAEQYAQTQQNKGHRQVAAETVISRVELQPGGVKAAVEAILAVADQPVSARELSAALIVSEPTVEAALDELYRDYNGYDDGETVHEPRGFELRRIAGGWRLYARSDFSPWVGRFVVGSTAKKLPKAVMETLSVIAYQQPVTRSYVASVRGVNADAAFRTLQQRGLIDQTVPDPETGAAQYITTDFFLEKMGLDSLDDLPPLAPFLPDVGDIELSGENP